MGDDSLSAITFDSDFETKAERKSFHKPPPTSLSHVPGTPVYREKEDMYDEIIELKKSLHVQKSDVDLMRTRLRRLEEENSRKDRQIQQLLDPPRDPDFVRTLAEKRPDAGWGLREKPRPRVVNGLKQRILRLEQQCKEKDNTINKLQTDMKTTNLEEMRIAMETYYEEIHRLQTLLASSETTGKKTPGEKRLGVKRPKKVSSALLSLSRSIQELTEENQSLKEDLDRVLSNSPTVSTTKGYTEWSKPRLLRRIAELEKKISSMESPTSQASEEVKSNAPVQSASSSTVPQQPRCDRHQDSERLRGTVRSLRGERDALQTQLQEKDRHTLSLEVRQLLQTNATLRKELEGVREGEEERRGREEALREEIQTLTKKFQELEEIKREEKDDPVEMTPETPEEPRPSLPTSRPSQQDSEPDTSEEGFSRPPSTCSEGRRDTAARILQSRWRVYRHQKKKAVLDEAAVVLQAAFRGHLARVKLLSSQACASEPPSPPRQDPPSPRVPSPTVQAQGSPGQEEAITAIQSVLRAHLARVRRRRARWSSNPMVLVPRERGRPGAPRSAAGQRAVAAAPRRRQPAPATHSQLSSPPCPAPSPGQEDSEASGGETAEGPAAEDEAPGNPAALQPRCGPSSPSGPGPADDGSSDDSDEIVVAPAVAPRKAASPP
ncbi:IQ domain-containing protein E [Prionailurus iriomotensis]